MVTSRAFQGLLLTVLAGVVTACAPSIEVRGGGGGAGPDGGPPPASGAHYRGKGFVVHEWGTDTIVVGSDGSLQRGMHHEEEDLPSFVYDRIKGGSLSGSTSVEVKMETPVTYFYSDKPMHAEVAVEFPQGVFTQWYPAVANFSPFIAPPTAVIGLDGTYGDPVLDPSFPFGSPACRKAYGTPQAIANGRLDWGTVEIHARGEAPAMPDASLDRYTWSFARQVDSNAVSMRGVPGATTTPESEKFLFYRGLGRFETPVQVTSAPGGHVTATNTLDDKVGTVFVLNVGAATAAFTEHAEGIGAEGDLADVAPPLDGAPSLDAFVASLGDRVTAALDRTGLFHDEAVAMVNTWKRQWFRTPGLRVLYLAPQSWTDASIPLSITPKPDAMTRVMMIRVEVITPELEQGDVAAVKLLAAKKTEDQGIMHFVALGRFAEPRLRRAIELAGNPAYAAPVLAALTTADTTHATD
jgi:hypothetical protein